MANTNNKLRGRSLGNIFRLRNHDANGVYLGEARLPRTI